MLRRPPNRAKRYAAMAAAAMRPRIEAERRRPAGDIHDTVAALEALILSALADGEGPFDAARTPYTPLTLH